MEKLEIGVQQAGQSLWYETEILQDDSHRYLTGLMTQDRDARKMSLT